MPKPTILVVDDELSIRESFALILEDSYRVITVASGEATLKKIVDEKIDLVYLDIRMPGLDGIETLKRIKEIDPDLEVVMVTAVNDVQKAGEAVNSGAQEYVIKPFDVDEILKMTRKLLERKALLRETKVLHVEAAKKPLELEVLGHARAMVEIGNIIDKATKNDSPVLIQGELGTEKELISCLIHEGSSRRTKPFKSLFIALGESESKLRRSLFGAGKGAFAAALQKETGVLEQAHEGTVLLHNVENLPAGLQKELAQVFQGGKMKREGSLASIPLNLRLLSSSSVSLKDLVRKGSFDKDLYGYLSKIFIDVPPLRQRSDDIPILASYAIEKFNRKYNKNIKGLTKETAEILMGYSWPGNMVEFQNVLERLVMLGDEEYISVEHLPIDIVIRSLATAMEEGKGLTLEGCSREFENQFIQHVLKRVNFDQEKAARLLGISPRAWDIKLETVHIKRE